MMKKIIFTLLPAIFLWLGPECFRDVATAQEPDPDPATAKSEEVTLGDDELVQDKSDTGHFEAVTVDPLATSDVALTFPGSFTGKSLVVQALDGGVVTGIDPNSSATVDQDGKLAFSVQVTDQPGVHRVILIDPNVDEDSPHIVGVVQFEVPEPAE
jgi:hypothetical protein